MLIILQNYATRKEINRIHIIIILSLQDIKMEKLISQVLIFMVIIQLKIILLQDSPNISDMHLLPINGTLIKLYNSAKSSCINVLLCSMSEIANLSINFNLLQLLQLEFRFWHHNMQLQTGISKIFVIEKIKNYGNDIKQIILSNLTLSI